MIFFIAAVLFVGLVESSPLISESDGIDYRLLPKRNVSTFDLKEECTVTGGLVCQDCTELGVCVWGGDDWVIQPGGPCGSGETCLGGECVTIENPKCPPTANFDFICATTGMYPDQTDCTVYHFCVPGKTVPTALEWYSDKCTDDYYYNVKTNFCDKKVPTGGCKSYPIPLCKKVGDTGIVKDNPSLYYQCVRHQSPPPNSDPNVIYPLVRACAHGGVYNPTTRVCK